MGFWLADSNGAVKLALTVTIYGRRLKIVVEKWDVPQGAVHPAPSQKMEIVRHPEPNWPRVSGEISFNFEAAFLLQARNATLTRVSEPD